MKINRMLTNLCSTNFEESKRFYTRLFDFHEEYSSEWFIQLVSENNHFELGIIQADHELVPEQYRGAPKGMYLTLVVESADSIYEKALAYGYEIVQPPELTFYGQKRLLIKDPAGILVDVSSPEST